MISPVVLNHNCHDHARMFALLSEQMLSDKDYFYLEKGGSSSWFLIKEAEKSDLLHQLANAPSTVLFRSSKTLLFPIQMICSIHNQRIEVELIVSDVPLDEKESIRYKELCIAGMKYLLNEEIIDD